MDFIKRLFQFVFAPPGFYPENVRVLKVFALLGMAAILAFTLTGFDLLRMPEELLKQRLPHYQGIKPLNVAVYEFFVDRLLIAAWLVLLFVALSARTSARMQPYILSFTIVSIVAAFAYLQGVLLVAKNSVQSYVIVLFAMMSFTYIPVWLSLLASAVGMAVLLLTMYAFAGQNPEAHNILVFLIFVHAMGIAVSAFSYWRRCRELLRERGLEIANRKLAERNRMLEKLAVFDSLTEITNRRYFDQNIAEILRNPTPFSLMLLDVDNFKKYNDNYGHVAGDEVLHTVAQAIKITLKRDADSVSRYGGEEFAVILPGTNHEGALKVAERIRENVEALGIRHEFNPAGVVTVSLGVVTTLRGQPVSEETLLKAADQCLYKSKELGRNRVTGVEMP